MKLFRTIKEDSGFIRFKHNIYSNEKWKSNTMYKYKKQINLFGKWITYSTHTDI